MFARSISRAAFAIRPVQSAIRVVPTFRIAPCAVRTFASTASAREDAAKQLVNKLKEERTYELENTEKEPEFVKEFTTRGIWKIEDKTGEKEVTLKRTFGNESIKVLFSTDALTDSEPMEQEEGEEESSVPIPVSIIIEKTGSPDVGALEISATAQDASFFIEAVSHSSSASILNDQTAEGDWIRRGKYNGPVFHDLDENLQDTFHDWLRERGFDEQLAEFLPQYIELKEQKEYTSWLGNVEKFVKTA
ncbi:Mitochondrial acidic protein mam33 [Rhizophlyctis rosea]|uniref:Mitochondrial acidic protein mam33 n=1 Tax=Rhizophlyctis rosea TaxID=64517 RepID=A0AAD5SKG9_9FUNG|nr:Mitochondrial acidic protein mam33 [Rhizophlyctis rosea]